MSHKTTLIALALGASLSAGCLKNYHVVDGAIPDDGTDIVEQDGSDVTGTDIVPPLDGGIDAQQDVATDSCDACGTAAARVLYPVGGMTISSRGVDFRLQLPPDFVNAGAEICPPSGLPGGCGNITSLVMADAGVTDGGVATIAIPTPANSGTYFVRAGEIDVSMGPARLTRTSPWVEIVVAKQGGPNAHHLTWGALPDFDGDGHMDVAVGGTGRPSDVTDGGGPANYGMVYLWSGAALSALATTVNEPGSRMPGSLFGASVASAGDVNGDGVPDLVVGRPFGGNEGAVYLYPGGPGFFAGIAGTTPQRIQGTEIAVPGATRLTNNSFGTSVASAGDVDGDGYADVIVGAPSRGSDVSYAILLFGGPDGLNASRILAIAGGAAAATFGASVAGIGDCNQDGFSDFAIGEPGPVDTGNNPLPGIVTVHSGGPRALLMSGSGMVFRLAAPSAAASDHFGASIAAVGDRDLDGTADFAVGAPGTGSDPGVVFLYGGRTGTGAPVVANTVAAATPPPTDGGVRSDDGFGAGLSGGHDFNNDAAIDFCVTTRGGMTYCYTSPTAYQLFGTRQPGLIQSGVSLEGDVDGDGFADVLVNDSDTTFGPSTLLVYGGPGHSAAPTFTLAPRDSDPGYGQTIAMLRRRWHSPWFSRQYAGL